VAKKTKFKCQQIRFEDRVVEVLQDWPGTIVQWQVVYGLNGYVLFVEYTEPEKYAKLDDEGL
jgi:hypothetical protein